MKVTGRLAGPGSRAPLDLAVAVNGTIEATAPAIALDPSSNRLFTVMIPESSLRQGANTVQLFAIEGGRLAGPAPARRNVSSAQAAISS